MADQNEQFVQLLTSYYQQIFLFILSLVPNRSEAEEILQETNIVLWRKFDQFDPGTNFKAWAFQIAYLNIRKHRERQSHDRLRFNEGFVQHMANVAIKTPDTVDLRREALVGCLSKLSEKDRDMIRCRYRAGGSVKGAAEELGRSTHAIYKALCRVRGMLHECIRVRLAMEERP